MRKRNASGSITRRNGVPFRGFISTGLPRVFLCDTAPQYYSTEIVFCLPLKSPSSIWKGPLFLTKIESKEARMISALILTFDEEVNIADCIASLPWRSDVHVLDSGSRDRTQEVARALGAKVTERSFTNYADQRNFGLALPFAHEWIVMIDADERVTPELWREIEQRIAGADYDTGMFRVRRKDMFMGRWLRRSSGYPSWFPRVIRRGRVRVEREINELFACDGRAGELTEHLIHYPFNKGIDWWFERHGRYSRSEERRVGKECRSRWSPYH